MEKDSLPNEHAPPFLLSCNDSPYLYPAFKAILDQNWNVCSLRSFEQITYVIGYDEYLKSKEEVQDDEDKKMVGASRKVESSNSLSTNDNTVAVLSTIHTDEGEKMAGVSKKVQMDDLPTVNNNTVAACVVHTTNQDEMVSNKEGKMDAADMF